MTITAHHMSNCIVVEDVTNLCCIPYLSTVFLQCKYIFTFYLTAPEGCYVFYPVAPEGGLSFSKECMYVPMLYTYV